MTRENAAQERASGERESDRHRWISGDWKYGAPELYHRTSSADLGNMRCATTAKDWRRTWTSVFATGVLRNGARSLATRPAQGGEKSAVCSVTRCRGGSKKTGHVARYDHQGMKSTDNPFDRLFVMPQGEATSRYQHWKFQV